jgi:hypothetical protein
MNSFENMIDKLTEEKNDLKSELYAVEDSFSKLERDRRVFVAKLYEFIDSLEGLEVAFRVKSELSSRGGDKGDALYYTGLSDAYSSVRRTIQEEFDRYL